MSHMTKRTTELRSAAAIEEAAKALGMQSLGAGSVRYYSGPGERADLRYGVPGSQYEIGFRRTAEGGYEAVADEEVFAAYETGRAAPIRRVIGAPVTVAGRAVVAPLFIQAYNIVVLAAKARGQGKHVTTERAGAVIRLRVRA